MSITTRDIRLKAAEIIEEHGWKRGGEIGPHGERCAVLALLAAAEDLGSSEERAYDAAVEIRRELGLLDRVISLSDWNDRAASGKTAVLAALRGGGR